MNTQTAINRAQTLDDVARELATGELPFDPTVPDASDFLTAHPGATTAAVVKALRPDLASLITSTYTDDMTSRRALLGAITSLHRCARSRGYGQAADGRWWMAQDSSEVAEAVAADRPTRATLDFLGG